ncbi:MAG: hypothetical protein HKM05_12015 [Spirochaetales bacterium]|nr:hypothetical protein [Spirochaetales bacterium]
MDPRPHIRDFLSATFIEKPIEVKLTEFNTTFNKYLAKWYRNSALDLALLIALAWIGLYSSYKTNNPNDLKLYTGLILDVTFLIFAWRRFQNIRFLVKTWPYLRLHGWPLVNRLLRAPWGQKFRAAGFYLYFFYYKAKTNVFIRGLHKLAAWTEIVPSNDNIFDCAIAKAKSVCVDLFLKKLLQYLFVALTIFALYFLVKWTISREENGLSIFELALFPFSFLLPHHSALRAANIRSLS